MCLAFSHDGNLLASDTFLRGVLVWDTSTRSLRWADRAHATWFRRVAWSPDDTRVAGGGDDGYVYVWDATDGRQRRQTALVGPAEREVRTGATGTSRNGVFTQDES